MSAPAGDVARFDRLPPVLRPRDRDDGGGPLRRSIELTVLIVIGLVLALATVNDTVSQVHIEERLAADKTTWHDYTHNAKVKIGLTQGVATTADIGCAPPSPGAGYRLCLVMSGPSRNGVRTVAGGYRLPLTGDDLYRHRYGCFGLPLEQAICSSVAPAPPQ